MALSIVSSRTREVYWFAVWLLQTDFSVLTQYLLYTLQKGALVADEEENPIPVDKHIKTMTKFSGGPPDAPVAPWLFAHAGREHSKR